MSDQVTSLTHEAPMFQLGVPPGAGVAACADNAVGMVIRHETGRIVSAEQVRLASGHTGGDYTGLTPGECLRALSAFGVTGYQYHAGVTAEDVLRATDHGLVIVGVGYWAYPTMKQAEIGGKTDSYGGPHSIVVAGRRYWATKPAPGAWDNAQIPFRPGWRFWDRDPDHPQGWPHAYDRASTTYLVRAMAAIVGNGNPPWTTTFMIAKGMTLRVTMETQPGFNTSMDQRTPVEGTAAPAAEAQVIGKLGLRPPTNAPALRLSAFLTGAIPDHPLAADNLTRVPAWILGGNDRYGVCGPVSVANNLLQVSTYLADAPVVLGQDEIFDLYRRSGNPGFDPATDADDNGVAMQTMLDALLTGGVGGYKPIAFARVDETNLDEVRAAIAIFGNLLFGVNLEVAQQDQTPSETWDYSPSAAWGGHAILAGSYDDEAGTLADRLGIVSWAEVIECTDAFLANQLGECWAVIWPWHLGTMQFRQGVNLAALVAAYKQLTGKDLPVPAPPPAPQPVPSPPAPQPSPPPVPPGARVIGCLLPAALLMAGLIALARR